MYTFLCSSSMLTILANGIQNAIWRSSRRKESYRLGPIREGHKCIELKSLQIPWTCGLYTKCLSFPKKKNHQFLFHFGRQHDVNERALDMYQKDLHFSLALDTDNM